MFNKMRDGLWKLDIPKNNMSCDDRSEGEVEAIFKLWRSDPEVGSYNFTKTYLQIIPIIQLPHYFWEWHR
jgi:hypothetical protein